MIVINCNKGHFGNYCDMVKWNQDENVHFKHFLYQQWVL